MLTKVELQLKFDPKRNKKIATPCCNKSNTDGKFVNYKGLPPNFGYCHSCGSTTLPPALFKDEKGDEFVWNNQTEKFDPLVLQNSNGDVIQPFYKNVIRCNTELQSSKKEIKYIPKPLLLRVYGVRPENNLIAYIRNTYKSCDTQTVIQMYYLGTNKDGGCVFWNINSKGFVQKAKVSYYKPDGKRTQYFKVPYKNEDGYYSCLFGEHLIDLPENKEKSIILVESEKTAVICALHIDEYVWLAYGGINGLTKDKLKVLQGRKVILVPDISENAVAIMKNKIHQLKEMGINAKIWDMTNGKTDEQLKKEGWYNCDLEDVFRVFVKK